MGEGHLWGLEDGGWLFRGGGVWVWDVEVWGENCELRGVKGPKESLSR